ncbi:MAG: AMP-binding protein, partial [Dermatophilus congolensis]|nr:AMP-binding protein [Dermatophilus congolensis]
MTTTLDPTLSHTRGDTDQPLLTTTIGDNLAATVARVGDNDALVDVEAGRRWTYNEFLSDVRRLASGLLRLGIRTGDRVGIWSPNRWEWTM